MKNRRLRYAAKCDRCAHKQMVTGDRETCPECGWTLRVIGRGRNEWADVVEEAARAAEVGADCDGGS